MQCPMCDRSVRAEFGRYAAHFTAGVRCAMAGLPLTPVGDGAEAMEARAQLAADLAWRLREEDPARVWDALTALSPAELQRVAVVALAMVDVDRSVPDSLAWVCDLPAARWTA